MISQYMIGTTLLNMVNIEELLENFDPPRSYPEQFSVVFDRGDGSQAGHGFPRTTWKWDVLTLEEAQALRVYCAGQSAAVYIRTRKLEQAAGDVGSFADYAAVMIWPRELEGRLDPSGLYLGVEFLFRRLVEQV